MSDNVPSPRGERRTWLVSEDAFPSLGFVLRQGRRLGFELRMLPRAAAAADARRLWGGTPSIAPFVVAAEGLRRVATQGIGGTLCLPLGADFDAVRHALAAIGARFDARGDVLRLSCHVCNGLDDAERLAGAWRAGAASQGAPR